MSKELLTQLKGVDSMKYTKAFVKDIGDREGIIEAAIITSEVVDREGDIIKADGGDFSDFERNPQLLWMHNRRDDRPPIGKVLKVWRDGKRWLFTPQFDMKDPFAADIFRKFKEGFLNAFSIGFIPSEREGSTFTKWSALEFSAVPVPANAEATVLLRSKGFETSEWKELYKEDVNWEEVANQMWGDMKKMVEDVKQVTLAYKQLATEHSRLLKKTRVKKVEDNPSMADIKTMTLILNKATSKVLEKMKGGVNK
jgi:hypothetical protein